MRLYVEGGGDSKALKTACRRGFAEFLKRAGLAERMPRIVACGGRRQTYDDFCTALAVRPEKLAFLLVDAEGPMESTSPWQHLRARDGWDRPVAATDDACHLMVQCMESWFLADRQALADAYGPRLRTGALPQNPRIEQIPKLDVLNGLIQATRDTQRGTYRKSEQSFSILGKLDPGRVEEAAPYARRFLNTLRTCAADDSRDRLPPRG
jgi:hypothetical protein